jgi:aminoglycoside phosphotransferase (APT) family kinase protein
MQKQAFSSNLANYLKSQNNSLDNFVVDNISEINMGWETELFTFKIYYGENSIRKSEELVIRMFSGDGASRKASKEYYLMKKLFEVGYPVPPVYNLETSGEVLGKPFLIMKRIMGRTLDEKYRSETPEIRFRGLTRLLELFVRLHDLNVIDFRGVPNLSFEDSIQRHIHHFEFTKDDKAEWIAPLIEWISENKPEIDPRYNSLCHMDYHGMNVMIDKDGQAYVIDWGASCVGDFRLDLAWTILLYSTFGGPQYREPIIERYETLSGEKVKELDFFEVFAATRRIADLIEVLNDTDSAGLKPDVLNLMSREKEHYIKVHDLLESRTGIRLKKLDTILDSF